MGRLNDVYLCSIVPLLYHQLCVVIITDQTECLVEVDPYIKPKELLEKRLGAGVEIEQL